MTRIQARAMMRVAWGFALAACAGTGVEVGGQGDCIRVLRVTAVTALRARVLAAQQKPAPVVMPDARVTGAAPHSLGACSAGGGPVEDGAGLGEELGEVDRADARQAAQLPDAGADHRGEGGGGQDHGGPGRGAQPLQRQCGAVAAAVGVPSQERWHGPVAEPGGSVRGGAGGQERRRDVRGQGVEQVLGPGQ